MKVSEAKKEVRKQMSNMETTINDIEEELQKEESAFRKDLFAFKFGMLQQQFVNLNEVIGVLDGSRQTKT